MVSLSRRYMTRASRFIKSLKITVLFMIFFVAIVILWIGSNWQSLNPKTTSHEAFSKIIPPLVDLNELNDEQRLEVKRTFNAGSWRSAFVSPFHKHYNVNCSGVLHGNQTVIDTAWKMVEKERENDRLVIPSDEEVSKWTENCEVYRETRCYPSKPWSQEEADYPVAYILTVHKDSAQVERLLRAIYQPQNIYCIHADMNSPDKFHMALRTLSSCFENVFLASKMETVVYRAFSRVQADLNCMKDLMSYQWNYVINLCGQDFPLKTNLEIVRQLKAYRGRNDIPGVYPIQTPRFLSETWEHHVVIFGVVVNTFMKKPPPPHTPLMYFGNAYYAATRGYVDYVLNNQTAKDIIQYLSDSNSPDEHVWVTLNRYPGVPGGYPKSTWASNVRFIRWTDSDHYEPCVGKYVRDICVIRAGFLPYVSKQPHLFVNKLYYDYDPIALQCLEDLLDFRTKFPETIKDFVDPYPVSHLFTVP